MESIKEVHNFINGSYIQKTGDFLPVTTPFTGETIANVYISTSDDVNEAVSYASNAFSSWSNLTFKARASIMYKFHALLDAHKDELAEIIINEHGKNRAEALASIAKGMETVEYACSIPQLISGNIQEVSRGVVCHDRRDPVGVVASIVPFNFPVMVPMWTIPISLVCGNTVILKPSEKVPLTMNRIAQLFHEAGIPSGVFQIVNGTKDAVEALIDHPDVKAVTFVGTTHIAEKVAQRARNLNKKCIALGGAKNHLVVAPDCDVDMATSDIMNSFTGCCGQRCMAASVLITLGEQKEFIDLLVEKSSKIQPGRESGFLGPVIDEASMNKILKYIDEAEKSGCKILLDGRKWCSKVHKDVHDPILEKGFWIGPTIILHTNKNDPAMVEEIFGPVISVYAAKSKEEAIEIENSSQYGNAASIYTSSGAIAEWFTKRFHTGMMGVNIGVPVPREPFSFGGRNRSKFGDHDITGDGAMEFFTERVKITTK